MSHLSYVPYRHGASDREILQELPILYPSNLLQSSFHREEKSNMVFHKEYLRILANSDTFAHTYAAGARGTAEIVRKVCIFQKGM
jgi:hypothetical protein